MKSSKLLWVMASLFLLGCLIAPQSMANAGEAEPAVSLSTGEWRLSAEINLSTSTPASHEEQPAIAYNDQHGEYLAVWHNNRPVTQDIYARRVSRHGELLSWYAVSTEANCKYPSVAYNRINDQYLVVWSQYNAFEGRWEILGRIISWNAPGTNTPFLIASWSSMNLELPVVAWNSYRNEYMLVWQTSLVSNGQLQGIGRRRLSNAGGFLSNADYITGAGSANQGTPDLAYNLAADGYLAVWVEPGASLPNIYAGRMNRDGVLQGSKYALESSTNEQQKPAITTNQQDHYFVVWQEYVDSDWDVHGREVNSATGAVLPTQYLIAIYLSIDETAPDIQCNPATGEYMTVWQETSPSGKAIRGVRWGAGVKAYTFEIAPGGMGDNQNPAVAADIPGYMIVYEWESWTPGSDGDIFGRVWWPEVVYIPYVQRQTP